MAAEGKSYTLTSIEARLLDDQTEQLQPQSELAYLSNQSDLANREGLLFGKKGDVLIVNKSKHHAWVIARSWHTPSELASEKGFDVGVGAAGTNVKLGTNLKRTAKYEAATVFDSKYRVKAGGGKQLHPMLKGSAGSQFLIYKEGQKHLVWAEWASTDDRSAWSLVFTGEPFEAQTSIDDDSSESDDEHEPAAAPAPAQAPAPATVQQHLMLYVAVVVAAVAVVAAVFVGYITGRASMV